MIAELAEVATDDKYSDWMDEITSFNLNARYDDYKKNFHDLYTKEYTEDWMNKITILREWIKTQL